MELSKDDVFINHILKHNEINLHEPKGKVICKICGKTVEQIYEEEHITYKNKLYKFNNKLIRIFNIILDD